MIKGRIHVFFKVACFFLLAFHSLFSVAQHKKKIHWYDKEKSKVHVSYFVLVNRPHIIDSSYEEYFPNGQLRSRGLYKLNKPVGQWEYYYENGFVRMKGEIKNFKNQGPWEYFHENGEKFMEGQLVNGTKNGDWTIYFDNGKIKSKGKYAMGTPVGKWIYYYEDGSPKAETSFDKGKGLYREFYKTGALKMEGLLIDGKSDSTWNYFHENGKLKACGIERNGLKDGYWKFFHDNGLIANEGLYLEGVPFGNWKYFHDNGVLSMEGTHKNGEKDGFWKLYYPTGEFKAETQFTMGEGPYKEYYESGKLKVTGFIRKGVNEGDWVYYFEDGNVEGKCQFEHGEGKFTGYYPNGTVKMEGKIHDGVKTGVWKLYKPQGELAGYYKTFYEDKQAQFIPIEQEEDTLKKAIKTDSIMANKKTDNEGKSTTFRRRRQSKIRYFRPKMNEYKALIVGTNPVAVVVYRQLPIYLEYIIEERIGLQFIYIYYKSPFFSNAANLPERIISYSGHGFELMQKFYHKNNGLGSLYFGQSLRYKTVNFNTVVNDTLATSSKVFHYNLKQTALEYAIIGGNRIFINGNGDNPGWSIDIFVGMGVGKLDNKFNPGIGYFNSEKIFEDIPQRDIYFFGKLGVSLGYMF